MKPRRASAAASFTVRGLSHRKPPMRRVFSFALSLSSLLGSLLVAGCEVSPDGGACQNTYDCDRTGSTTTRDCVRYGRRELPCGTNNDCICCPRDPALADMIDGCRAGTVVDSSTPTPDAIETDTGSDAGPDVAPMTCLTTCPTGQYCDTRTSMCAAQRTTGATCTAANECSSGFCAQSVCCLTACTGAGVSCNTDEAFRGQCVRTTGSPDAGAVDSGAVDSGATDSGARDAASDVGADAAIDAASDAGADAAIDGNG